MPDYIGAIDQGTTSTRFIDFRPRRATSSPARRRSTSRSIRGRAGWSTTPTRSGAAPERWSPRRWQQRGLRPARPGGHRHHQPARNHRAVESPHRPAGGQCPGLAGYARGRLRLRIGARRAAPTASARKTGLPLATYFSSLKIRWLLDHVPRRARAGRGGRAAVRHHRHLPAVAAHRRPGGLHITDCTNASRTQLMNLRDARLGPGAAERVRHPARRFCRRSAPAAKSTARPRWTR